MGYPWEPWDSHGTYGIPMGLTCPMGIPVLCTPLVRAVWTAWCRWRWCSSSTRTSAVHTAALGTPAAAPSGSTAHWLDAPGGRSAVPCTDSSRTSTSRRSSFSWSSPAASLWYFASFTTSTWNYVSLSIIQRYVMAYCWQQLRPNIESLPTAWRLHSSYAKPSE